MSKFEVVSLPTLPPGNSFTPKNKKFKENILLSKAKAPPTLQKKQPLFACGWVIEHVHKKYYHAISYFLPPSFKLKFKLLLHFQIVE